MTNEARTIMADINIPRPCHKSSLGRSARSLSLSLALGHSQCEVADAAPSCIETTTAMAWPRPAWPCAECSM